ncbi:MAG: type II secretion system protein [Dehalococcoidia bacterium]|nr:type II secretion system protein [Dehalococcoidia bacterium]
MKHCESTISHERGFTLVEMLVVLVILGALASVVVLAITQFYGKGNAEAANTEVHNAHAAISCCLADAGVVQLDTDVPVNWDGSDDVVTATSAGGVTYDASTSLRGKRLKATYTVNPSGEITGVADQEWSGITWENGRWKKDKHN